MPEQNSFETEKNLLNILGEKNFRLVNVLTFDRMSDFIFRKIGGNFRDKLTDSARNMFMSMAIEKAEPELKLYKKSIDDIEMVSMMVDTLKEMKICSLSYEDIKKGCDRLEEGILKQKLGEISCILKFYEELTREEFSDPLDALTKLLHILKKTKLLKDYTLFVDSFYAFPVQRLNLLQEIISQCKDTFITFCTDQKSALFSNINNVLKKIASVARTNSIEVSECLLPDGSKRFKHNDLKHLEKNIFAPAKETFAPTPENILLYDASDVYDECEFLARTIRKRVIQDGFRYRDFAVITGSIEKYAEKIENCFSKYDIPYFMNHPQKIENKALLCTVFSAFDVAISNFESENIFRYLKPGLVGLDTEDIAILENYAFLWGISGDSWTKPFTMSPEGFGFSKNRSDRENLQKIEGIRVKVITPLVNFRQNITRKNGYEISRAVYELLEDINIQENIRSFCKSSSDILDLLNAEEQGRLWNILMNSLDQTANILKDIKINPKRFKKLLKIVVQSENMSFIPQGSDEVTINSVDRREISEYKILFIIGAQEGEFPQTSVKMGVFNDNEKKMLSSVGMELFDDFETIYDKERFITYWALSSASEKLYVSWASSTISGEFMFPSEIVREIKSIFPEIKILDKYSIPLNDWLWAEKPSFEICAKNWNSKNDISLSLKKYFFSQEKYTHKINSINRIINKQEMNFNNPIKAQNLFGKIIRMSASQIEKFYSCKFQYFCRYGLNAKERKRAKFNLLEYGTLIHFVLEKILNGVIKCDSLDSDQTQINEKIKTVMNEYIENYMGGWENKSSRFKYLFLRCSQTLEFLVKRLFDEFKASSFRPVDCELSISERGDIKPLKLSLPDGGSVVIEGKVDRVDVMGSGGKSYVRVIDYKTGSKKFKLADVIYGLNMQMLFYLAAIDKNGQSRYGNIVPSGILYMPAVRPYVKLENEENKEDFERKIYEKTRMNGLILGNMEVIRGMENEAGGLFIPVSVKDGIINGDESFVNSQQMQIIMRYAESMAVQMGENLHSGKISIDPIRNENIKSCDWCPYGAVCCREDEDCFEISNKSSKAELIQEMQKKLGDKNIE